MAKLTNQVEPLEIKGGTARLVVTPTYPYYMCILGCDTVVTPEPICDYFSPEYHNYIKLRVQESPLKLSENPFFPDFRYAQEKERQENK